MTPSTAAFRGVWGVPLVLMRNYEPNPFESVQVVYLVKLRMGRQRGGQACAARPCWRRSRRACLSFNNLQNYRFRGETAFGWGQCRLRLHALQQVAGLLQTGFSAAYGSTRINFLPSKPPINFSYRGLFFALFCYFSYVICAK